ncbi:MAG: hypothetical protein AAF799_28955 [Myxococcota bacterium]
MLRSIGLRGSAWFCLCLALACTRENPAFNDDAELGTTAASEAGGGVGGADGDTAAPMGSDSAATSGGGQGMTGDGAADMTGADEGSSGDQVPPPETTGEVEEPAGVLFVNFDGVTLAFGLDNATTNTSEIAGRFAGLPLAPFGRGPQQEEIMDRLHEIWDPFNVEVTDERPESGNFAMIVVTPTNPFGFEALGVASQDCGNGNPNSVGFAFSSVDAQISTDVVALAVSHSAGRGYGLESVEGEDIMSGDPIPGVMFTEPCRALAQQPMCGQHQDFCPPGQQSSALELEAALPWR